MFEGQDACRSEWPALLLNVLVTSGPELQLRVISGSIILMKPGSVLVSKAPVTIKGLADPEIEGYVGV